jgi:hypothetical protein
LAHTTSITNPTTAINSQSGLPNSVRSDDAPCPPGSSSIRLSKNGNERSGGVECASLICRASRSRLDCACASVTPGFNLAITLNHPIFRSSSVSVPGINSGRDITVVQTSDGRSSRVPVKPAGAMPMTVKLASLSRTLRPTRAGSPPKLRRHNP